MRKHYLDNIRCFADVIVVLYHVFYMYNAEGILGGVGPITNLDIQYYDLFQYIVYPWLMMLLFIVSGISARLYFGSTDSEKHTNKEFIKTRTTRLLVPSTIGLFAFQFIQGFVNASISGVFVSEQEIPAVGKAIICILSGTGVLWYIQLLWVLCLVLVLVRKIEKNRFWNLIEEKYSVTEEGPSKACTALTLVIITALGALVWAFSNILNTPIIVVYRFGLYGIAFFLGYFVFSHDGIIEILKKYFWIFALASIGLGTWFCIKYFGQNYADKPINRSPLFISYGYLSCLTIIGLFSKFFDFENSFTRWMNKRGFGLYVFHYLGISAFALFIAKPGLVSPGLAYPLTLIAGLISGYGLYEIISRIPFWRWAVLGIKKPRQKKTEENEPDVQG